MRAREMSREATIQTASPDAIRARNNLGFFGQYVADKAPARHHQEWIDALVTGKNSQCLSLIAGEDIDILAPRGSAKSTWIALFVAWAIGHNPSIQIIYISYSESVALSRSRIIKRIIESDKYREIFPHILPGKRWSDTDWEIRKDFAGVTSLDSDYTFYATGITGSITSRRSHLIVGDDVIKNSESIKNPDVREKIETNWDEALEPTLVPGGRKLDIGTIFSANDIHSTKFTLAKKWKRLVQSAIVENPITGEEESYWKERFSIEELREIREKNPIVFSFQYQNKITRISETSIDPSWIHYGDIPERFDSLCIGGDLASSLKEKADYTVFVLGGRIGNKFYILDIRRGRWSGNIEKLDQIIELWEEWEELPMTLSAESVAYQSSLKGDFVHYLINEKQIFNLTYQQPTTKGDKLQRLRGVSGLFQNNLVIFNQYRDLSRLVDELINFGSMDKDDCVDAVVYCLQGLIGRRKLEVG
jgi:predicted phage terminase large subunit-like protein